MQEITGYPNLDAALTDTYGRHALGGFFFGTLGLNLAHLVASKWCEPFKAVTKLYNDVKGLYLEHRQNDEPST